MSLFFFSHPLFSADAAFSLRDKKKKRQEEEVETDEGRGGLFSVVDERSPIWCQEGDETASFCKQKTVI